MIEKHRPLPSMEIETKTYDKSPLEEALENKRRMNTIRQKYNIRHPKEMKLPSMQWEGEDRS